MDTPVPAPWRVALLVDFDNFRNSCRENGTRCNAAALKAAARSAGGDLAYSAVFADSSFLDDTEREGLHAAGFEIVDCPKMSGAGAKRKKDTVDQVIIQKLNAIAGYLPFHEVLLASFDRDFIPAVQRVRDAGKRVRIVVPVPHASSLLVGCSDGVVVYDGAARGVAASGKAAVQAQTALAKAIITAVVAGARQREWIAGKTLWERIRMASPAYLDMTEGDLRPVLDHLVTEGAICRASSNGKKKLPKRIWPNLDHPLVIAAGVPSVKAATPPPSDAAQLAPPTDAPDVQEGLALSVNDTSTTK